jgi:hypothetical protein
MHDLRFAFQFMKLLQSALGSLVFCTVPRTVPCGSTCSVSQDVYIIHMSEERKNYRCHKHVQLRIHSYK